MPTTDPSPDDAQPRTANARTTSPVGIARSAWADAAKGMCIVLVVLWHVVHKDYTGHSWGVGNASRAWELLTLSLVPLRMPLFFLVSGVFAASALRRAWRVLLRDRVVKLYWLFALWVVVQIPVFLAVPSFPTTQPTDPGALLRALTFEPPNVWYLYALAWFVVVARLLVRVPTAFVLGPALVLSSVAATGVFPLTGNATGILQYFFFFVVGLRMRAVVVHVAEAADAVRLVVSGTVFALLATFLLFTPGWWVDVLEPVVGLSAVHFGVTLAALVPRARWVGAAMTAVGRRTLPVYVLHLPLVAALFVLGEHVDLDAVDPVYPLVATGLVCAAALGLERVIRAAGLGGWLFDLPRPIAHLVAPADPPGTVTEPGRGSGQPARRPRAR